MTWKDRVEIRKVLKNKFPSAAEKVLQNKRKCSICGCIETLENIIISYDGVLLCDNCLPSDLPDDDLPF